MDSTVILFVKNHKDEDLRIWYDSVPELNGIRITLGSCVTRKKISKAYTYDELESPWFPTTVKILDEMYDELMKAQKESRMNFSNGDMTRKSYRNDCDVCVHGTGMCMLTSRECAREGFQKAEKDEVIKRLRLNVYPYENAKANMIQYLLDEFGYVYEKEDN